MSDELEKRELRDGSDEQKTLEIPLSGSDICCCGMCCVYISIQIPEEEQSFCEQYWDNGASDLKATIGGIEVPIVSHGNSFGTEGYVRVKCNGSMDTCVITGLPCGIDMNPYQVQLSGVSELDPPEYLYPGVMCEKVYEYTGTLKFEKKEASVSVSFYDEDTKDCWGDRDINLSMCGVTFSFPAFVLPASQSVPIPCYVDCATWEGTVYIDDDMGADFTTHTTVSDCSVSVVIKRRRTSVCIPFTSLKCSCCNLADAAFDVTLYHNYSNRYQAHNARIQGDALCFEVEGCNDDKDNSGATGTGAAGEYHVVVSFDGMPCTMQGDLEGSFTLVKHYNSYEVTNVVRFNEPVCYCQTSVSLNIFPVCEAYPIDDVEFEIELQCEENQAVVRMHANAHGAYYEGDELCACGKIIDWGPKTFEHDGEQYSINFSMSGDLTVIACDNNELGSADVVKWVDPTAKTEYLYRFDCGSYLCDPAVNSCEMCKECEDGHICFRVIGQGEYVYDSCDASIHGDALVPCNGQGAGLSVEVYDFDTECYENVSAYVLVGEHSEANITVVALYRHEYLKCHYTVTTYVDQEDASGSPCPCAEDEERVVVTLPNGDEEEICADGGSYEYDACIDNDPVITAKSDLVDIVSIETECIDNCGYDCINKRISVRCSCLPFFIVDLYNEDYDGSDGTGPTAHSAQLDFPARVPGPAIRKGRIKTFKREYDDEPQTGDDPPQPGYKVSKWINGSSSDHRNYSVSAKEGTPLTGLQEILMQLIEEEYGICFHAPVFPELPEVMPPKRYDFMVITVVVKRKESHTVHWYAPEWALTNVKLPESSMPTYCRWVEFLSELYCIDEPFRGPPDEIPMPHADDMPFEPAYWANPEYTEWGPTPPCIDECLEDESNDGCWLEDESNDEGSTPSPWNPQQEEEEIPKEAVFPEFVTGELEYRCVFRRKMTTIFFDVLSQFDDNDSNDQNFNPNRSWIPWVGPQAEAIKDCEFTTSIGDGVRISGYANRDIPEEMIEEVQKQIEEIMVFMQCEPEEPPSPKPHDYVEDDGKRYKRKFALKSTTPVLTNDLFKKFPLSDVTVPCTHEMVPPGSYMPFAMWFGGIPWSGPTVYVGEGNEITLPDCSTFELPECARCIGWDMTEIPPTMPPEGVVARLNLVKKRVRIRFNLVVGSIDSPYDPFHSFIFGGGPFVNSEVEVDCGDPFPIPEFKPEFAIESPIGNYTYTVLCDPSGCGEHGYGVMYNSYTVKWNGEWLGCEADEPIPDGGDIGVLGSDDYPVLDEYGPVVDVFMLYEWEGNGYGGTRFDFVEWLAGKKEFATWSGGNPCPDMANGDLVWDADAVTSLLPSQ